MSIPRQGEIWWGETPQAKSRPFLVICRDEAIPVLRDIPVAPVTRTMRDIPSELPLGKDEGLKTDCVASFDNVFSISKALLVRRMGALSTARSPDFCAALSAVADC